MIWIRLCKTHDFGGKKTCCQKFRCEQGSNLRGKIPLDFKSNALTTRPSQLTAVIDVNLSIWHHAVPTTFTPKANASKLCVPCLYDIENVKSFVLGLSWYYAKYILSGLDRHLFGNVVFVRQKFDLFPLGLEPRTSRVLGERDNHYTTETSMIHLWIDSVSCTTNATFRMLSWQI